MGALRLIYTWIITIRTGGADEGEFIIYPVKGEEFRIGGVGYLVIDGERFVHITLGNKMATCVSL
jgi:hypothetical protein